MIFSSLGAQLMDILMAFTGFQIHGPHANGNRKHCGVLHISSSKAVTIVVVISMIFLGLFNIRDANSAPDQIE
jgi:hypothetical protein